MFERRFRKADFYAARDRLRQQVDWTLLKAFLASGYTVRQVAKRLQKPQSWVESRLFGSGEMRLTEIAELAWAIGHVPRIALLPMTEIKTNPLTYRPTTWLKVHTSTSVYALGQAWDNERKLAA